jgi:uncharacterized protein (TIGR03086 family)
MDTTMRRAAAPTLTVLRRIASDQLTAPTPCTEYDVRALISHLLQWGPMMAGAGRRQAVGQVDDDAGDEWLSAIEKVTADIVDAWSAPGAWEGIAQMAGPMPATTVGGLTAAEFVLHGWDLARATGVDASWPDDVVAVAYEATAGTAEQGRAIGVYAAPVELAPEASAMDRLLAVSGRNPQWTPAG